MVNNILTPQKVYSVRTPADFTKEKNAKYIYDDKVSLVHVNNVIQDKNGQYAMSPQRLLRHCCVGPNFVSVGYIYFWQCVVDFFVWFSGCWPNHRLCLLLLSLYLPQTRRLMSHQIHADLFQFDSIPGSFSLLYRIHLNRWALSKLLKTYINQNKAPHTHTYIVLLILSQDELFDWGLYLLSNYFIFKSVAAARDCIYTVRALDADCINTNCNTSPSK